MSKELIDFNEYIEIEKKLEIRIGSIVDADVIPKSKKMVKLRVSFSGELDAPEMKTVVTNLGDKFGIKDFIGIRCPFITNLAPVTIMGVMSEAMIVVAEKNGNVELTDYSIGSKLL